jgi:hypothetical protein
MKNPHSNEWRNKSSQNEANMEIQKPEHLPVHVSAVLKRVSVPQHKKSVMPAQRRTQCPDRQTDTDKQTDRTKNVFLICLGSIIKQNKQHFVSSSLLTGLASSWLIYPPNVLKA